MIGFLHGSIYQVEGDSLILDVKGVGYELCCSQNTMNAIQGREIVQLMVHTHVREDIIQLFGFSSKNEKKLFLSLVKVNGIGPKLAISILSAARIEAIIDMIDKGDVKGLMKLPKVGKKTAEQIILSLKGKLVTAEDSTSEQGFVARKEIISALVNLGFRLTDVENVVSQMDPQTDLQQGVRHGLAALTAQL